MKVRSYDMWGNPIWIEENPAPDEQNLQKTKPKRKRGSFEPPYAVKTVRDLIYWEYAHLVAKSAGFADNYRFIMSRYQKLKKGEMKMSGLVRDDKKMLECERCCFYCGSKDNLSFDHIIPRSKGGPDIISNQVLACRRCNSSKGDKDIFYWYGIERKEEIPKNVLSKYLKLVYDFHEQMETLDRTDINMDGKLDVMDLAIFKDTIGKNGEIK